MAGVNPGTIYSLSELVGEGTFGAVWSATHNNGDRVAIKVVPVDDAAELAEEIDILKRCESPFVVEYLGAYEINDQVWIVMELCDASVADVIQYSPAAQQAHGRGLDEDAIRVLVAFMLLGLEYLHSQNLIHRDIKAGNVLLANGQAKLADFGVAARLTTLHSKRETMTGAPYWMAPEVISQVRYGSGADIWSLGISVIEFAQGKPPHSHIHAMRVIFVIEAKPPPELDDQDQFSPDMSDFLAKCLVKDADRRSTASELMAHPFVSETIDELSKNNMQSPVLASLMEEALPHIEAGRAEHKHDFAEGSTVPSSLNTTLKTNQSST